MTDDDSDDSDEWGMEELVIPSQLEKSDADNTRMMAETTMIKDKDDDYWAVEKNTDTNTNDDSKEKASEDDETTQQQQRQQEEAGGEPMIIVDITQMDPEIHSKFDRNSVNHPEKASALRKKLEKNYDEYKSCHKLLSEGTVIPCGSSVWRSALVRLRDDRPGHYFVPVFPAPPPKTK